MMDVSIEIFATSTASISIVLAAISAWMGVYDWAGIFVLVCILALVLMALPAFVN